MFDVVPAKAGTHIHSYLPLHDAGATARFSNARLWLWVPAFAGTTVCLLRGTKHRRGVTRNAWAYAETPVFRANGHATVVPQCGNGPECTA